MRWSIVLPLLLVAMSGCGLVEPRTSVSYSPLWGLSVSNTKDTDVEVRNAKWKDLEIEYLKLRDNASDVMTANVAQMAVIVEQMKVTGQNIKEGIAEFSNLIRSATPLAGMFTSGAAINTPLGGGSVSNAAIGSIVEAWLEKRFGKIPASAPTTQPAE